MMRAVCGSSAATAKEVKDSAVGWPLPIWLPDGRLAWQTPDRQNYRIRDLWTGRDEYLLNENTRGELVFDPTFSPRGDQLVLRRNEYPSDLSLLSWPSREERWLTVQARPIGWSADGEWIYAIQDTVTARSLVRVSSRTGEPKTIGEFPVGLWPNNCDLTCGRDAIVCSLTEEKSDAWVMGDFDPDIP